MTSHLSLQTFSEALLETADLDPLYVIVHATQLPRWQLGRFIIAYSLVYHAGAAAWACAHKDFWGAMDHLRTKGPRGTERRHWRAELASHTMVYLRPHSPEHVLQQWFLEETFDSVWRNVQRWPGFGPWIGFKIADTAERVAYARVTDWNASALRFYREPRKGAALYRYGDQDHEISDTELADIVNGLIQDFSGHLAPPLYDRPVNVQEIETILCKWKSHVNGRYPIGKDTKEILHHLHGGWGELAEYMAECPLL